MTATDAGDGDGPRDADLVGIDACTSFSAQFDTCGLPAGAAMMLTDVEYDYDTDSGSLDEIDSQGNMIATTFPPHVKVMALTGMIDVLLVTTLDIKAGTELQVTGSLPFGIVATGTVTISGRIDADGGAGHRSFSACGAAAGKIGVGNASGGGGGGGGAFATAGAGGGAGAGAAGGASTPLATVPIGPLGGCSGARGGTGSVTGSGGSGGLGGGAVYIASAVQISVVAGGLIEAGGNGGSGGGGAVGVGYLAGGGGGGSGGMVWLEASHVMIRGTLVANGGAGGEGSGPTAAGNDGDRGHASASVAIGGAGGDVAGGDGGNGAANTTSAASGLAATAGGGGGGGVGYIKIVGTGDIAGSVISPPPS